MNIPPSYLLNIFNYKLYKYTNKTYIKFVNNLIADNNLEELDIKATYLDNYNQKDFYNELFLITQTGEISFFHKENLVNFIYPERCKINYLLNVNIKNQKTYELIKVIESLQKRFLITNDLKDIKTIKHDEILDTHKKMFNSFLSKPVISLILNNTKYRDKNNNIYKLSYLTPKKHFTDYIRIKRILNIYPFATDELIKKELLNRYDIDISVVQVFKIRKKYFIPNRLQRKKINDYARFEFYFNESKLLTNKNTYLYQNTKAVYELISSLPINYNYKISKTIYIGSSKNLYKRLNEYINKKGHTQKIREYLKTNAVYFRVIETQHYKKLETILLNEFIDSYGELPLLNTNSSKK